MPQRYFAIILTVFCLALTGWLEAQDFRIGRDDQVSTCSGRLLDSGGAAGNHASSGRQVTTVCPAGGEASARVVFSTIDIFGTLSIYNGANDAAPLLGDIDDLLNGRSIIFAATAANSSGCLTFVFEPNSTQAPGTGWIAQLSCTTPCQPIQAVLLSSDPVSSPAGPDGYIDICPGDAITLTGSGRYPEDGVQYAQSDATSTFTWNFQNGDVLEGREVTYVYDEPGGYVVQLTIEDRRGCTNGNRIGQRVRVAPPPRFSFRDNPPQEICPGEEAIINVDNATNPDANFTVTPRNFTFATSQARTETVFLPDGNGDTYRSPLVFTNFDPGQVLQSASDIVQICAVMEHSWLGDLDIALECPGGESIKLHGYQTDGEPQVGGQRLGRADRSTTTPDPPGTYCWTTGATETMRRLVERRELELGDIIPEQDYRPDDSFAGLAGCELNGEWTIAITDNLGRDEGYIFEWSITFADEVYPVQENFTVPINNAVIKPNAFYQNATPTRAVINTDLPGPKTVKIESEDDFGCVFDTTFLIEVVSPFDESCYTCPTYAPRTVIDTGACSGDSFVLDAGLVGTEDTAIIYRAVPNQTIEADLYNSPGNAFGAFLTINQFNPNRLTDVSSDLTEICLDVTDADDLSDLSFELVSPSGETVTLLSNFNGSGGELRQTCFSAAATADIATATAPYTGTFRPADNLAALNGTQVNGQWTLNVWDTGGNNRSEFVAWSIGLVYDQGISYAWTADGPGFDFSCTDCPNPTLTPSNEGVINLAVTNAQGCTESVTVNISLSALNATPQSTVTPTQCNGGDDGAISVTLTGATGVSYEWSNGASGPNLTGLAAGDYTVTITNDSGCFDEFTYTVTEPTEVTAEKSMTPVSCNGGNDGSVNYTISGGTPPYTVSWSAPSGAMTEDVDDLSAGTYVVQIRDANGCGFADDVEVTEPELLEANTSSTTVICRGEANGTATVVPSGGTGPYTFAWDDGQTEATATGLSAGSYEVVVTDANSCTAGATVEVVQPAEALSATITPGLSGCSGASANAATAMPLGGAGSYTFAWSNGETTPTASSLPDGEVSVVVTDANGCTTTATTNLVSLPPVTINITPTPPTCNGGADGQLMAVATGGSGSAPGDYTFIWEDGQTASTIDSLVGERTYSVVATGPGGCMGMQDIFLPTAAPIEIQPDITAVSCFAETDGRIDLATITGPNPGGFTIQWGMEADSATSTVISNLAAGDYPVTITDAAGCRLATAVTVTQPDTLTQLADQANISCFGEADGAIAITPSGGTGPFTFIWDTGSTTGRLSGLAPGDYSLTLTDGNGCVAIDTYAIIEPALLVAIPIVDSISCENGRNGIISIDAQGGTGPFEYRISGRGRSFEPDFRGLGPGTYEVDVTDANGCQADTSATLEEGPPFLVDLGPDTTIVFGDSITLMPTIIGGRDTLGYEFQPSANTIVSCLDCPNPTIRPEFELDYRLTVLDAKGCVAEDRLRVSVEKIREVAIPTGFSPDGNGRNDRLLVHGRPGTRVVSFQVYDRWTNILYEDGDFAVNDPTKGWDGMHQDKPVNAGVYLYKVVVEYDDLSRETHSGQTTLIR